jgi:branched-chain amino acid transport system permease protein
VRRAGFWAGVALFLVGFGLLYLPLGDFYYFLASRAAASLLAVAGLNLALGYTGLFSFGHAAIFAVGAYATAITVTDHGWPVWAGFLAAGMCGVLLGGALSLATLRARATIFAVITLVLVFAVGELLQGWTSVTHGEVGLSVRRPVILGESLTDLKYWRFALVLTGILLLATRNLIRSPLGRAMVAVRESEAAAASVGVNPFRYRFLALAFGGVLAAVGGALFAHLDGYISADLAEFGPATLLVASLLVGGAGTLWGPVLGVGFFLAMDRSLTAFQEAVPGVDVQALISAVALFTVIVFLPEGVAGAVVKLFRRYSPLPARRAQRDAAAVLPVPRRPAGREPVLEVRGLVKSFGGVRAVDGLDLSVGPRTIHGLIGPNGSGKTTTVNLVTGVLRADAGEIRCLGEAVERPRPHVMADRGLGRVFQRAEVLASAGALDNVLAGFHLVADRSLAANVLRLPWTQRREREIHREAEALLEALGLGDAADVPASALPYGDRRLLEMARALAARPTVLILDEPATGLSGLELSRLSALMARLREGGVTVLLIEHNMEFLMELCDRVTVLDYGRKIAEGTPSEVQSDRHVLRAYLGSEAG